MNLKKILQAAFVMVIMCGLFSKSSTAFTLSEQAEISVITCAPGDEVYSVYGHSAIRVKDIGFKYDVVFHYGIFDFSSPNFLYRFCAGQTDYLIGAYRFKDFIQEFVADERKVSEQVLELSFNEKQKILDFLIWNARKENRVYRYNFFFDNCATRIRDVVVNNLDGGIVYTEESSHKTLRQLIKDYHGDMLWLDFGIDFLISSPSEREAALTEEMFLPDNVLKYFATAKRSDDKTPLVKTTNILVKGKPLDLSQSVFTGPFALALVLLLLVLWFTFKQYRKGKIEPGIDYILFGISGLGGLLVAWFASYSEHPAMHPNYNLLWLVPLNFLFVLVWCVKKWRPVLKYYHVLMALWLILFLGAAAAFIPQTFHPVFFLIVLMVLSRSVLHSVFIFQKKEIS